MIGTATVAARGVLGQVFRSLAYRDFRLLWLGVVGSLTGYWIHLVAQGWLVYNLTNSPFLLGLTGFMGSIPLLLFAPFGGVLADRVDRRQLLIYTRLVYAVVTLVLAALTSLELVTVWQVLLIAFISGSVMAFDMPSRQALAPTLVPPSDLANAVALFSIAFNGTRIVGPAIAGFAVGVIDVAGCFYLTAICHLVMLGTLVVMRTSKAPPKTGESVWQSLTNGMSYVWRTKIVLALMVLATVPSLFGMPYVALLPVFARDVLQIGAGGLGMLFAATGIGAVAGLVTLAAAGDFPGKGRVVLSSVFAFGLLLVGFALSHSFPLSLALLAAVGAAASVALTTVNALLQGLVPNQLRGRVMSLYMLTWGLVPVGQLQLGALADWVSSGFAVAFGGAVCALLALVMAARVSTLRRL
ncbi:MAG: MFS transporter [Chloroflexi bacterium]|nr:MFS transporter [Chloroflexota bacterium]